VVTAAASLADRTEQSLLQQHAAFVAGLPCDNQAKRLRRAGAERLLARHPDLQGWMGLPACQLPTGSSSSELSFSRTPGVAKNAVPAPT
jgi:hypothetical protein